MTSTPTQGLLPCPFCGTRPEMVDTEARFWAHGPDTEDCFLHSVIFDDTVSEIAQWNTRAALPASSGGDEDRDHPGVPDDLIGRIFVTTVSGGGEKPYLKIQCQSFEDLNAVHDSLDRIRAAHAFNARKLHLLPNDSEALRLARDAMARTYHNPEQQKAAIQCAIIEGMRLAIEACNSTLPNPTEQSSSPADVEMTIPEMIATKNALNDKINAALVAEAEASR